MSSAFTAAQFNQHVGDRPIIVRTREPEEFQYIDVGTWACPNAVILSCLHRDVIPVDSVVLGEPVAEICLTCNEQLPVPWPEESP
jgi:hypothetical protein